MSGMNDNVDSVVRHSCGDCQHYSDGECYELFEAVSVHCDCEGPIDGMRVDKDFCCKFYAANDAAGRTVEMSQQESAASFVRSDALLGCPFCGNIPKLCELVHDRWEIVCAGPCDLGKVTTGPYCNVHECVEAWNTRQPNAGAVPRRDVVTSPLLGDESKGGGR